MKVSVEKTKGMPMKKIKAILPDGQVLELLVKEIEVLEEKSKTDYNKEAINAEAFRIFSDAKTPKQVLNDFVDLFYNVDDNDDCFLTESDFEKLQRYSEIGMYVITKQPSLKNDFLRLVIEPSMENEKTFFYKLEPYLDNLRIFLNSS